jgi:isocitrate dehydrogenase kinase/phosphatase
MQEAEMERADWLDEGFDSAQARFLLVTAITHHRFNSPIWGEHEVRKLHAELVEIDSAALQAASAYQMRRRLI